MSGPPESERATGNRGTTQRGEPAGPPKAAKPKAKQPARNTKGGGGPAKRGDQLGAGCRDFITNDPEQSNPRRGTGVHRVIREQLSTHFTSQGYGPHVPIRLPDASFDPYRDKPGLQLGSRRAGEGDVDLAFGSLDGTVMSIAEIKPANWEGILGGIQLQNYIDKANDNDEIKRAYGVKNFVRMDPSRFILRPLVYWLGRAFEIRWCDAGIILYKEVRRKDDEEKEKKTKPQTYKEQIKGQRATSMESKAASWPNRIEILRSAPREQSLPDWTPERLRRDIAAGSLADGLYRDRYSAPWAYGSSGNVVVWVKTSAFGKEYQYYQEYPTDAAFYEAFASRRGLSDWQTALIRTTLSDYNRDLWSLIAPDPQTNLPSSRSPDYARQELRAIYGEVLKGVFLGSAAIVTSGAAITSVSNSMAQRGTAQNPATPGRRQASQAEEPLPGWVQENVQKGAAQFFEALEREMRVAP